MALLFVFVLLVAVVLAVLLTVGVIILIFRQSDTKKLDQGGDGNPPAQR